MNNKSLLALFVGAVISTQIVFAEKKQEANIFKCTNQKGDIFYNDKPCPKQDEEKKLRAIKDPKNTPGYAKNLAADQESLSALNATEETKWNAIDLKVKKELEEYRKSQKGKASSTSNKSPAGSSSVTKQALAAMTGSERENHEEHMELEQQQIARENPGEEKATQN